jgi:hypothetical protein
MPHQRYADEYPDGFWVHITANNDDEEIEIEGWDVQCLVVNQYAAENGERAYYVDTSDNSVMIDHPDEGEYWVYNWEETHPPGKPSKRIPGKNVSDYPDGMWVRVTAPNESEGERYDMTGMTSKCLPVGDGDTFINERGHVRVEINPKVGRPWWVSHWEEIDPPEEAQAERSAKKYVKDYPDGFWIHVTKENPGEEYANSKDLIARCNAVYSDSGGEYHVDPSDGMVQICHPEMGDWWISDGCWEEVDPPKVEEPTSEDLQEGLSYIESLMGSES